MLEMQISSYVDVGNVDLNICLQIYISNIYIWIFIMIEDTKDLCMNVCMNVYINLVDL